MEDFFEKFLRESEWFDVAHAVVTGITDTWYGIPVAVGCGLAILGLLFRLTLGFQRRHLAQRNQRDEENP